MLWFKKLTQSSAAWGWITIYEFVWPFQALQRETLHLPGAGNKRRCSQTEEKRVYMTAADVKAMAAGGDRVLVEQKAGAGRGFGDAAEAKAGDA